MSHESPYVPPVGSNPDPLTLRFQQVSNLKIDYGATGGGSLDDAPALRQVGSDLIAAGGGYIHIPIGTYICNRDGSNAYSVSFTGLNNCTISGIRGQSWLKHPAGMPNASVPLLKLERCNNVTIRDLGFDGNWGNAFTTVNELSHGIALGSTINVVDTTDFPISGTIQVQTTAAAFQTVTYTGKNATQFTGCTGGTGTLVRGYSIGYVNNHTGINHTTQSDPKNYLIWCSGSSNVTVQNCQFKQCYGDFIWVGGTSADKTNWPKNIRIVDCDMDMTARHGLTFGSASIGVTMERCTIKNVWGNPVFEQTNQYPVRDFTMSHCTLSGWWDPDHGQGGAGAGNATFGCDSVNGAEQTLGPALRNWRITDNILMGGNSLGSVWDFVFERNHVVMDWATPGIAPLKVQIGGGDIQIRDNWIYSRCSLGVSGHVDGAGNSACIVLFNSSTSNDGAGNAIEFPPTSAQITGNIIHARNARDGILLAAAGGIVLTSTGTASAVGLLSLTGPGGWTVNQWEGCTVRIGNAIASINSNTATVLTLDGIDNSSGTAWQTFHGEYAATPAPGTYYISRPTGFCDVRNNQIDCADDGNGAGGVGIWVTQGSGLTGTRARVVDNKIRNATGVGVYVQWHVNTSMRFLEIRDNVGTDDQPTATMIATVGYSTIPHVTKWIQRGNSNDEGVLLPVCNQMALSSTGSNNLGHTGHNCIDGQGPMYLTNIVGCAPLVSGTPYWVFTNGANNLKVASSQANALAHTVINIATGSCTGFIQGPTFSVWLEEDGAAPRWAGVGSPETVITASPGATYRRLDGGAGTCTYVKETGQGNTGWVGK